MGFYFYGWYIYIEGDEKEVERDMYVAIPCFGVLMIVMGIRNGKAILKLSLVIFFDIWTEVLLCPNGAGWKSLLVVERQP